jgi:NADPH2:quinone reductase
MGKPDFLRETAEALERMVEDGFVRPVVGVRLGFDQAAEALRVIDRREALGKVVLERSG